MPPTTEAKPRQFALTLTEEELLMLKELAADADDSAAKTVRSLVRAAYAKRFKFKIPGAVVMPTIRAIIDDIIGPPHFTEGNIVTRTGLPFPLLHDLLTRFQKRGILECEEHIKPQEGQHPVRHEAENWTWRILGTREQALARIAKAGLDVDADLTQRT